MRGKWASGDAGLTGNHARKFRDGRLTPNPRAGGDRGFRPA